MRLAVHCLAILLLVTEGSAIAFMTVNTVNRFTNPKAVVSLTTNPFGDLLTMPERMIIAAQKTKTSFVKLMPESSPEKPLAKAAKTLLSPKSNQSTVTKSQPAAVIATTRKPEPKAELKELDSLPEASKKSVAKAESGSPSASPKPKTSTANSGAKKPVKADNKAVASKKAAKSSPVAAAEPKPSSSRLAQSEKPEGLFTLVP